MFLKLVGLTDYELCREKEKFCIIQMLRQQYSYDL